ncbi:MAG: SCO family protein [Phycisphaerales bacterium]|nr:SCO family protein [Phycisphaerales bacterium]
MSTPAPAQAQLISSEPPKAVQGLDITDRRGDTIPLDLQFTDSDGKPVSLSAHFNRGRPVVIQLMYFRCPILCPKVRQETVESFTQLNFAIGKDYDAIFVSFDERDTPLDAAKQKTGALYDYQSPERPLNDTIRAGFEFLTGPAATSRRLADALGFHYRYLPESGEFAHGSCIFVLSADGTVSSFLPGVEFDPTHLRLALIAAGEGKTGSLIDRIMLWCYHYDPRAGTFTLQAVKIMKVGGLLTMTLLGGLIGSLIFAERRRKTRAASSIAAQSIPRSPAPSAVPAIGHAR